MLGRRSNHHWRKARVVRKAMLAAKESGKPLSVSCVLALLTENGVKIPEYLTRLIGLA